MRSGPTAGGEALSDAARGRRNEALRAAQGAFGLDHVVIAFLDRRHPTLRRRPLELAVESDAGLAAVVATIIAERPWPI